MEVVVAGRNNVKVGGKGERAEKLFLHYAQRSASLLNLLLITVPRAIGLKVLEAMFQSTCLHVRWAKDYLRRRLDWVVEDRYGEQVTPNLLNTYNINKHTN